jgi:hypothetical protein
LILGEGDAEIGIFPKGRDGMPAEGRAEILLLVAGVFGHVDQLVSETLIIA